tara:strand:- start:154 stop:432 length:279 start_codon:yes stop_codon:yes gene_type:complete
MAETKGKLAVKTARCLPDRSNFAASSRRSTMAAHLREAPTAAASSGLRFFVFTVAPLSERNLMNRYSQVGWASAHLILVGWHSSGAGNAALR